MRSEKAAAHARLSTWISVPTDAEFKGRVQRFARATGRSVASILREGARQFMETHTADERRGLTLLGAAQRKGGSR
jgi:hypothetical protein